ncbi:MAG: flagellar biosynthesis anti-sigma factor FlgM [Porticoccaceae bacterium]|jgi:negative regulator of flagellin synthesis FlgM|tara:strand:+ start:832 stop:1134 length:303 start_codon:yes stop_codon:yes gene_type:complete
MTDSISQLGKASVQVNSGADKIKSRSADAAAPQAPDKAIARPGTDEIVLSAVVETALANAEFDATKVARIKEAIEQGNYPLDSKRIAENFMAIESMIGGK